MAKDNILSFYNYIENDPKISKKMEKLKPLEDSSLEKFSKKVSKMAHKAGFEFSNDELLDYLNEKKSSVEKKNEVLAAAGGTKKKFTKGELVATKVAKKAILNDATDKADTFHFDNYKND